MIKKFNIFYNEMNDKDFPAETELTEFGLCKDERNEQNLNREQVACFY